LIPRGQIKVKTIFYVKTDVKGRRLSQLKGLGTQVIFADNDECHKLDYFLISVHKRLKKINL